MWELGSCLFEHKLRKQQMNNRIEINKQSLPCKCKINVDTLWSLQRVN